ncbi:sigma-70 family RNA polymerase sigma factor [Spirosoma daeguense]
MGTHYQKDDQLSYSFQHQKTETFSQVYNTYAQPVYRLLVRWVKDETVAQDLLQDTFLKVWTKSDSYNPQLGSLFTWIVTIAKRLTLDELKNKQIHSLAHQYIYDQATANAVQGILEGKAETFPLTHFHAKYREIIELIYFKSYTHQEVADQLGLPLGTVKTRYRLVMQQLKKHYSNDIYQFYCS